MKFRLAVTCVALSCASMALGNTCTPNAVAANGPFAAVPSNGVDAISWSVARVNWTSDLPATSTQQRIQYATAAEWSSGGPFAVSQSVTYPHMTAQMNQTPTTTAAGAFIVGQTYTITSIGTTSFTAIGAASNTVGATFTATGAGAGNGSATLTNSIQNGILSNLQPNTVYHVLAQSYQGGAWCSAIDQTFTTLAKPAVVFPTLPTAVDMTRPAMNGTHWYMTNGGTLPGGYSACGTTSGSTTPIVTANLQDCMTKALSNPGDDLSIPPGPYPYSQVTLPNSHNAVSVSVSGSTFGTSAAAPANGSQVMFGYATYGSVPSPLNPGVPYYVVSSNAPTTPGTFQVSSTIGGSAIVLLNTGTTVQYLPWPITQAKSVIHSAAAANLLPPPGVRLGSDALAQYYPNMPNLQAEDAAVDRATNIGNLWFGPLTANVVFENIRFSVDPAVATSTSATDPVSFLFPLSLQLTNVGIGFDQVAVDPGPPPTRTEGFTFEGANNYITNSYVLTDYWQPHYYATQLWTVTANTISLPVSTWSYVGAGDTKVSCPSLGGTITISGSASGTIALWVDANCTWEAQLPTGLTASSTVPGMVITNAASPDYPTSNYTQPLGSTVTTWNCIPFYKLTVSGGSITDTNTTISQNFFDPGQSKQQGGGALPIAIDGYGPIAVKNNYIKGSAILGVFWQEGLTLQTTLCGTANPCTVQTILGNLSVIRNTITTDANKFFYDSPNWDGGNRYWRNGPETKNGRFTLYDGNIIGPLSTQVGAGQCVLHEEFETGFIQVGSYPPYNDSSDFTFIFNTCLNTPAGVDTSYGFIGYQTRPYPIRNFLMQNNLFLNNNSFAQIAQNTPFASALASPDRTNGACAQGALLTYAPGENFLFDHNTVSGQGGCQPFIVYYNSDFNSGGFTNNVLNFVTDSTGPWASYTQYGTIFNNQGYLSGSCVGTSGLTMLGCINNFQWAGNVMLATWKNSYPGALSDLTTSDIATAQGYFPSSGSIWPNANTLAGRQTQVGFRDVTNNDLRLKLSSPYISAGCVTTDCKDAGADMEQLAVHQGQIRSVRVTAISSTGFTLSFEAPDSFACGVDYGSTAFYNGGGTWARVAGAAGSPDPRQQNVSVSGITAHSLVYYRLNCAVQQPTGSVQLP